jgi:hypothetical protein
MKHTKGPWELLDGRNIKTVNGIFYLAYGCDEHSKMPFFFSKENGWSELDANAKLTAAAPELLTALQELLYSTEPTFDNRHEREAAIAAINKATGE